MNKQACMLLVVISVALSGCGGKWYHDEYGSEENNRYYQKDASFCKNEAYKQYPPRQYDNVVSTVTTGLLTGAGIYAHMDEDEYTTARDTAFANCLREKGWYLVD